MRRFFLYCALVVVVTPFVLPVFWNELTWLNWRFFVVIGAACAVVLVAAAVAGSRLAADSEASHPRLRRALREFLDSDE